MVEAAEPWWFGDIGFKEKKLALILGLGSRGGTAVGRRISVCWLIVVAAGSDGGGTTGEAVRKREKASKREM